MPEFQKIWQPKWGKVCKRNAGNFGKRIECLEREDRVILAPRQTGSDGPIVKNWRRNKC